MEHQFINTIAPDQTSADIYLYGAIGEDSDDRINGDDFARELRYLDKTVDLVNLHVNSGGGNVFHGFSIISAIRSMVTPVAVYIDGVAASIAAVIAVSGDTIYMHEYSMLMIHDPFMSGGEKATKKQQKLLDKVRASLVKILSSRDIPAETVSALMAEEVWFSATEAHERGLCDEILASAAGTPVAEKPQEVLDRVMNSYKKTIEPTKTIENMSITVAAAAALNIAADASAEVVSSGITAMSGELAAVKAELSELKKEKEQAKKAEASKIVNEAIRLGKIDASAREVYETLFDKDFEAAAKALNGLPKPAGIASQLVGGGAAAAAGVNDLEAMSWGEIDKANRLSELKNKFPELYASKFEAQFGRKPKQ